MGVVVSDGVVVTAAHTVEGDVRALTVDGEPAQLLVVDERTDLALLGAPTPDATAARLATTASPTATVIGPAGPMSVRVMSTGPLIVNDTTARRRHERDVHQFSPGVPEGTSGAPLLDGDGRLLGIVVLDDRTVDAGYAVTSSEVAALLAAPRDPPHGIGCPG